MTSQYETNLWSTHENTVRLAEPISRCVRWRTQVFKIEGFVCKRFLPPPPPPSSFIFWLSFLFSFGQKRSFFAPKPNGNACYAGQSYLDFALLFMAKIHSLTYQGPVIWSKLDISIRSSKSLDLFKRRIKLVNFTSLLDSTCKDCFFM